MQENKSDQPGKKEIAGYLLLVAYVIEIVQFAAMQQMALQCNPDSSIGQGRLCPKGTVAIMMLYDPNRVNVPLKRTNPEKGVGIDPKYLTEKGF